MFCELVGKIKLVKITKAVRAFLVVAKLLFSNYEISKGLKFNKN
jgi:hypothetical protein